MKTNLLGLLAAALLCSCLWGCTGQPEATDPAAPEDTASVETTAATTPATGIPAPGVDVTPPDEMPEKPDAEYELPPEEGPGDRDDISEY